ncbi:MAG: glycoside hydrolase family 31 protein [Gemmatimonadetes bacterium]|nr:glycoside hydrolase family 31 protein [Gemmatimonadota bacterium]
MSVRNNVCLVVATVTVFTPWRVPLGAQEARVPVADSAAVVRAGQARFTVLTSRMVRMEWSADGDFEDQGTLVVVNRRLQVPTFRTATEGGWRVIRTDALTLRYREGSGRFAPDNLEVHIGTGSVDTTWRPGLAPAGNLGGTIRTLDGVKGPVDMGQGLVSRDGWAVVDDSDSPLMVGEGPPWVAARSQGEHQDWYLLGYGHDYRAALGDWAKVSGPMPLPPHFAFGVWWSRYWAYTDQEEMSLVRAFDTFGVPLDVLVVDMDWHNTFELRWGTSARDAAGHTKGWTGYTWDKAYFPEPEAFMSWVHHQGLRVTLNLHPASGIQPWEAQYEKVARDMGVDPATKEYIPFEIWDRHFAQVYFDDVIHPLERQGVDFWWLDWQQENTTGIPGLNPTIWLNHVFFNDKRLEGKERPIIFHRFGGLGSQRYQVGFSGDAASTWEMLAFEPEFTATAANVLYGFWSHDIGGHLPGPVSPELYTRWIQFGALSPVLRTHTTKNADAERRIWAYPPAYFEAMRAAMLFRTELVPYLYTAARTAHDTGVSMLYPLYYDWPEDGVAYAHRGEYMLGPDLLVNPVSGPADTLSGLATQTTWLPPGDWIEWQTGARLEGPATVERRYAMDQIPLFLKAGSVIPMQEATTRVGDAAKGPLVVTVFPGADGTARLYQDAGNDEGYLQGQNAWTRLASAWTDGGRHLRVDVSAADGTYPGMPQRRGLVLRMPGSFPPERVQVGGVDVPHVTDGSAPGWSYDGEAMAVVVRLPEAAVSTPRSMDLDFPDVDPSLVEGVAGTLARIQAARDVLEGLWPDDWPSDAFVSLTQTGRRIELRPETAASELRTLRDDLPGAIAKIHDLKGNEAIKAKALAILGG